MSNPQEVNSITHYNIQNLDFNININNTNSANQAVNAKSLKSSNVQPVTVQAQFQEQENKPNQQIDFTNFLQHANHPAVVFFTLLFKIIAIILFIVLNLFGVSQALTFILVVILSAFDFWFVKNVSGRILVGLRWWNEVKEDGSEIWVFESDHENRATSIDTTIFWGSIYITPAFWGLFIIIEFIGFNLMKFLVCVIAFILTFSNTIGYYKCSGEQKKKLTSFIANKGQAGFSKIMSAAVQNAQNNSYVII